MSYKLIMEEYINEVESEGRVYKHTSGATIITLKNKDDNKVFSITFRTLPKDDTGEAHILEHCVLNGSKKYNLDTFNELSKGTLNTYLNAMTFFDKTMYPIASTNEKEFKKLMDAYLDGVFFPILYEREELFLQEGHHKTESGTNGVVYNEMKAAFSTPVKILDYELKKHIYPDTGYKYYSGGVPEAITSLTYKELLDFHKLYYHPSNSIIYLYGDLDMEVYLEYIHNDYLQGFEDIGLKTEYKSQKTFDRPKEIIKTYSVHETIDKSTYLSAGYVVDAKMQTQLEILVDILLGTQASPLKTALIKSGIASNISGHLDTHIFQPRICITAEKSNEKDTVKFRDVIESSLRQIVKGGIDDDLKTACINKYEFGLREEDYGRRPKGLVYNINLMRTFLYNEYSFEPLKKLSALQDIRNTNFERLIEKYLLNNNHSVYLALKAEIKEEEKAFEKIADTKPVDGLNNAAENSEKIPLLELTEIKRGIEQINMTEEKLGDTRLYLLEEKTNGITYVNFMFNTKKVKSVNYIGLIKYLLSKVDTVNFSHERLSNEINTYLGDLDVYFKNYASVYDDRYSAFLCLNIKMFKENTDKAYLIAEEIIVNTLFNNKERLRHLLLELKTKMERNLITNGHQVAILRSGAYYSEACSYSEEVGGIGFYSFIKGLADNFESRYDEIVTNLNETKEKIFTKENLEISVTTDGYDEKLEKLQIDFIGKLSDRERKAEQYIFKVSNENEGVIVDSRVHYNVVSGNYKKTGFEYSGSLCVLNKILTSGYLWNRLRTIGGAYGCGSKFNEDGTMYFYSYADPNISKTYDTYKETYRYVEKIDLSERELRKYIIGAINQIDKPLRAYEKGYIALGRVKAGITEEFLLKQREELLKTSLNDLRSFSQMIKLTVEQNNICTVGNGKNISGSKELFKRILPLI